MTEMGTRAAVAIVDDNGYSIGYADLDVPGYTPTTYSYETYEAASAAAADINALAFDLTPERALEIVASSMRGALT